MLLENGSGKRPAGLLTPARVSAIAVPASSPPYQAESSAAAPAAAELTARALPLVRITTTGLPVAIIAFTRLSCVSGRSISLRSWPSPSCDPFRPTNTSATSESLTTFSASASNTGAGGIQFSSAPPPGPFCVYSTLTAYLRPPSNCIGGGPPRRGPWRCPGPQPAGGGPGGALGVGFFFSRDNLI